MSDYVDFISGSDRDCAIVAHRGAWHGAPENSIPAIETAIENGYEIVEIDVRRSADGQLFLLHDDTLERMAGIARMPEEFTLAELGAITLRNADGGTGAAMTAYTVPSLAQVFETTRGRIFIDLDLKDLSLFEDAAALARQMGVSRQVDLKADVDTEAEMRWVRAHIEGSDVPFMAKARFLNGQGDESARNVIASGAFMCEAKFSDLTALAEQAERLNSAGIPVWVNTLDPVNSAGFRDSEALRHPDGIWGKLIAAGVSIIQTDEPKALQAYLRGAS